MPNVEMNPVRFDELSELALNMREADRREVFRSSGLTPENSLQRALERSDWVRSGRVNGRLVCLYGLSEIDKSMGVGSPWMLGTDLVEECGVTVLRQSKAVIDEMLREYPVLMNYVDAENEVSIRWLEWLGFAIGEPEILGAMSHPFRRFEMRRYV